MLGIPRLEVETDFTKNFRASSPIPAAYDRVETRLGGAGVWDVLVPIEGDVDAATLVAIDRLESRLRAIEVAGPEGPRPALTKVMSVADLVAAVSPLSLERLSDSALGNWLVGKSVAVMRDRLPGMTRAVIGRDPADGTTWLRVMLRSRERQPAEAKRAIIDEVREVVAEEFPADAGGRAGEVTGFFVLLASLVERMVAALHRQDFAEYLALMADSGRSSGLYLQNCVPVSNPGEQGVVIALALTEHYFQSSGLRIGVDGACRVHGGGFAGTIQVLLPTDHVEQYESFIAGNLGANAVTRLNIRNSGAIAVPA